MDKPKAVIAIGMKGDSSEESKEGVSFSGPDDLLHEDADKDGEMLMCKVAEDGPGKYRLLEVDGIPVGGEDDEADEPASAMDVFSSGKAKMLGN